MLIIQPTADGRLRIQNNHRSDVARDESAARTLAYNWGHTDISINKALSEMRASSRGEAQPAGWRVARPEPKAARERVAEPPQRVEIAAPVAERAAPAAPKRRRASRPVEAPPAPAPEPTPPPAAKPPSKRAKKESPATRPAAATPPPAPAPKRARKAPAPTATKPAPPAKEAAKPTAPAKAPARPTDAAKPPRDRALALFRDGVKELAEIEGATLAFARGPWSELREMAEYIAACLEGKRPKTGWSRER